MGARRLTWTVLAPALIGAFTGAAVAALNGGVEGWLMTATVAALPDGWPALATAFALPLAVLVAVTVTRTLRPSTSELYIVTYHTPGAHVPLRQLPGRVLAAIATVGLGGSQGFESPSALIGASLGECFGRVPRLALSADEVRALVVAGASAGIAAIFSSPGVGTLYGIEVPFRRDVDTPRLVPAAIAASVAFAVRGALIGAKPLVVVADRPSFDVPFIVTIILLAIACGLGARLFAAALTTLRDIGHRHGPWTRAATGGVVLAGLAWIGHALTGAWITFGPGYIAADWSVAAAHAPEVLVAVLAVRTAGTLISVYGGGGGGVFTSLACTGLLLAVLLERLLGLVPGGPLALLGSATFLASGYRIPLAGMLLVAEQSGDLALTCIGIVSIAIGQTMMGDASVSDAQHDRRE
ncbi:MAG TPA: chloride channel protein [Candidatus Binatia bacterium]|jgi:CIC family chloride channel protein|nr:chloride channel protein [Candidatus Binatia bacterium]